MSNNDLLKAAEGHWFYRHYGKRILDILVSGLVTLLLSPLLLFLALLVRIRHGSPILFSPTRPGKDEKIFRLYKFRSMTNAKDSQGKLLPEKDRLTRFGKLLRASSLDEIPELINILKGDMSLVGPRPLAKNYLVYYTSEQRLRHAVRPGLTGLAQISGRNNLPWDERIEKDIEYVRMLSLKTDISILVKTVMKVLKSSDIVVPGQALPVDLVANNMIKEEGETHTVRETTTWPEIGSHFWLDKDPSDLKPKEPELSFLPVEDCTCTFSGRSAIRLAIEDAMQHKEIRTAYVPSYCCLSMLQAMIDLNIKYEFYDVVSEGESIRYKVRSNARCDLLLIMEYFGIGQRHTDEFIRKMKKKGCVVIEDITHSLLCSKPGCPDSDYYTASLRKWFAIPAGGWLGKRHGVLEQKPDLDSNDGVENRIAGMREKSTYIHTGEGDKTDFLKKFAAFENDMVLFSPMLKIDDVSASILAEENMDSVRIIRRENAAALYEGLRSVEGLRFLIGGFRIDQDTPLFVPVMIKNGKRDALRKYLIDNGVYCPVHWPEIMGARPGIRTEELSLICDQRYTTKDME